MFKTNFTIYNAFLALTEFSIAICLVFMTLVAVKTKLILIALNVKYCRLITSRQCKTSVKPGTSKWTFYCNHFILGHCFNDDIKYHWNPVSIQKIQCVGIIYFDTSYSHSS